MGKEQLVGTWKLDSAEYRLSNGERLKLYDTGILMYDALGYMSVQLMKNDRPAFAKADRMGGTSEEIKTAFQGYQAYYGTFTVDEGKSTVTHHLQGCVLPNWVGVDQVRFYKLSDNRLTLQTPPLTIRGMEAVGYLIWQHAE